eukprot:TRINITY_DN17387_c0_g2_i1.p1 TRINITY_DN17387_c0_g2~~TRINITY_DN17387_c0_g2_i1.p1  ORF type:complete len:708 (-),score=161.08 TRINITY_DN17387_c0_g2_i1:56-2179(-)
MGNDGSKATQPLSIEELRSLWNKHDTNGTGEMERAEVGALMDDIRLRYGLDEPFSDNFIDAIFAEIDVDDTGYWTWHDFRQLGGESYFKIRKNFQRQRLRDKRMNPQAKRQAEKLKGRTQNTGFLQTVKEATVGADTAKKGRSKTAEEKGEEIEIKLHSLRVDGLLRDDQNFFFRPSLWVRVVRGNPKRGVVGERSLSAALAALEGPSETEVEVPPDILEEDPIWENPIRLTFFGKKALYVHVVLKDGDPLADMSWPMEEILNMMENPKVQKFRFDVLNKARMDPDSYLVGQWGGPKPRFTTPIYVFRAENLPEGENLVVEIEFKSRRKKTSLFKGELTPALEGPHPMWRADIATDLNDERDMLLYCTVYVQEGLVISNNIACQELIRPVEQKEIEEGGICKRRALRPLNGYPGGAFVTLGFGIPFGQALFVRPRTVGGVAPVEEATSFDPYVKVIICSEDPRKGIAGTTIAEAQTETLHNVLGDPYWKEPCILNVVNEEDCFVRIIVCCDRARGSLDDELADMVVPLEEAFIQMVAPLEKQYDLRLLVPRRKHADPIMFLSFGEMGGKSAQEDKAAALDGSNRENWDKTAEAAQEAGFGADPPAAGSGGGPGGRSGAAPARQPWRPPHLSQVLQAQGLAIPQSFREPEFAPLARPPLVASLEEVESRRERANLGLDARLRGGMMQGQVPLSFLMATGNPHAAWIRR